MILRAVLLAVMAASSSAMPASEPWIDEDELVAGTPILTPGGAE